MKLKRLFVVIISSILLYFVPLWISSSILPIREDPSILHYCLIWLIGVLILIIIVLLTFLLYVGLFSLIAWIIDSERSWVIIIDLYDDFVDWLNKPFSDLNQSTDNIVTSKINNPFKKLFY